MKKIYCEPKTKVVNVTIENLLQSASQKFQVSGSQSNENALSRGGDSSWDFDDEEY